MSNESALYWRQLYDSHPRGIVITVTVLHSYALMPVTLMPCCCCLIHTDFGIVCTPNMRDFKLILTSFNWLTLYWCVRIAWARSFLCGCCCSCHFFFSSLFHGPNTCIVCLQTQQQTTQPQYNIAAMWRCHGQKRDESTSNIDAVGTRFIPLPLWLCSNIFLTCLKFVEPSNKNWTISREEYVVEFEMHVWKNEKKERITNKTNAKITNTNKLLH